MVSKNSSETVKCSYSTKMLIENELKELFLDDYPEYDGRYITNNQILVWLIKDKLGVFYGKHSSRYNK